MFGLILLIWSAIVLIAHLCTRVNNRVLLHDDNNINMV